MPAKSLFEKVVVTAFCSLDQIHSDGGSVGALGLEGTAFIIGVLVEFTVEIPEVQGRELTAGSLLEAVRLMRLAQLFSLPLRSQLQRLEDLCGHDLNVMITLPIYMFLILPAVI